MGGAYPNRKPQPDPAPPRRIVERDCPMCRKVTKFELRGGGFICTECFPDLDQSRDA